MKIDPVFIKDIIYPALVAVLATIFSYIATYILNNKQLDSNRRIQSVDLIDKLIIEMSKIISSFDKLNDNAEKKNFFAIDTIQNVKPIVARLKDLSNNVTILSDDNLRQKIVENIDYSSELVNEIDTLEMNPVLGYQELTKITKEREAEYRALSARLLEMGLYYDNTSSTFQHITKPKISKKQTTNVDRKLEAIQNILTNLVQDINNSQLKLNQVNQENQNKRSYFAIKILNSQTQLRALLNILAEARLILTRGASNYQRLNPLDSNS